MGNISSINTSVNVQYQKNCGSGKKFVVSYTNQVVINSTTFSAGGDSGSLIVSNDNPICRHPVALLFAGSSSSTIATRSQKSSPRSPPPWVRRSLLWEASAQIRFPTNRFRMARSQVSLRASRSGAR